MKSIASFVFSLPPSSRFHYRTIIVWAAFLSIFGCGREPLTLTEDAESSKDDTILQFDETHLLNRVQQFSKYCKELRSATASERTAFNDQPINDGLSLIESTLHYNFYEVKSSISNAHTTSLTINISKTSNGYLTSQSPTGETPRDE